MKIQFFENKHGIDISLSPETPAEMAQLARYAKNAKKEAPVVDLYFSSDHPNMSIWLKKVDEKKQSNTLNNR